MLWDRRSGRFDTQEIHDHTPLCRLIANRITYTNGALVAQLGAEVMTPSSTSIRFIFTFWGGGASEELAKGCQKNKSFSSISAFLYIKSPLLPEIISPSIFPLSHFPSSFCPWTKEVTKHSDLVCTRVFTIQFCFYKPMASTQYWSDEAQQKKWLSDIKVSFIQCN